MNTMVLSTREPGTVSRVSRRPLAFFRSPSGTGRPDVWRIESVTRGSQKVLHQIEELAGKDHLPIVGSQKGGDTGRSCKGTPTQTSHRDGYVGRIFSHPDCRIPA